MKAMSLLVCLALIAPGTATSPARAAPAQDATPAELTGRLDTAVREEMASAHVPGAVVVVVRDGRVVFSKGYGHADVQTRRPVTPEETIFRIGSISKVFTATAVVQLADRGRIALGDDVNKHLSGLRVPATYPRPITVEHLLTHTSGLDEINLGRQTTEAARVIPMREFLSTRLVRRLPAGESISYSTYGITLAGYLVQSVTRADFRRYLERNIFKPLQMRRTSIGETPDLDRPNLAVGYAWSGGRHQPRGFEHFHTYPASDVNSTGADMARFMLAHLEGERQSRGPLMSGAAMRNMHRRQFGNHPALAGMAYGFSETVRNGVPAIEHGGTMDGFAALMYLAPQERLGIFVAGNLETQGLRARVKEVVLDHYFPRRPRPAPVDRNLGPADRFAGRYQSDVYCHSCPEGARGFVPSPVRIGSEPNGAIKMFGAEWVQIEPLLFELRSGQLDTGATRIAFRTDASGTVTHMLNGIYVHERLSDTPPATMTVEPAVLASYVGVYRISPAQTVTVTLQNGQLAGEMTGLGSVELTPTSPTRFTGADGEAILNFHRGPQGVSHLMLTFGGQELRGERVPSK